MDIFMEFRQEIEQLAENDYKKFSASLLPGVDKVLGVRLPQLRKLASRIAAGDWQRYLAAEPIILRRSCCRAWSLALSR